MEKIFIVGGCLFLALVAGFVYALCRASSDADKHAARLESQKESTSNKNKK